MADFNAYFVTEHTHNIWTDAESASRPSRLNAAVGLPHRYISVAQNLPCVVHCDPEGGVAAAPDSELDGRLFQSWFAEYPNVIMAISPVGYSSIIQFTPVVLGNYLLVIFRDGGGTIGIPFTVEAP